MALFEELGQDVRERRTAEGVATLWTLAPNIYVSRVSGYMDESHADLFEAYGDARVRAAGGRKLRVFHDWFDMTGYEPDCRKRLTSWSVAHRAQFEEVHLGMKSKIVAMGVQVANIALGGLMRAHGTRVSLELELRRAMRDEGARS